MEDGLLDLHLHPDHLRLQIVVDQILRLLDQLLYVPLFEHALQLLMVGQHEKVLVVVEEFLKQGPRQQTDPVYFLGKLLQEQPDHLGNYFLADLPPGLRVQAVAVDNGHDR